MSTNTNTNVNATGEVVNTVEITTTHLAYDGSETSQIETKHRASANVVTNVSAWETEDNNTEKVLPDEYTTAITAIDSMELPAFSDNELKKEVTLIVREFHSIRQSMLAIGSSLYRIRERKLWKKDPKTKDLTFNEFMAYTFNLSHATGYRYINNALPYLNDDGTVSEFSKRLSDAVIRAKTFEDTSVRDRVKISKYMETNDIDPETLTPEQAADIKAKALDKPVTTVTAPTEGKKVVSLFLPDKEILIDEKDYNIIYMFCFSHASNDISVKEEKQAVMNITHTINGGVSMVSYVLTKGAEDDKTMYLIVRYTVGKGSKEYRYVMPITK